MFYLDEIPADMALDWIGNDGNDIKFRYANAYSNIDARRITTTHHMLIGCPTQTDVEAVMNKHPQTTHQHADGKGGTARPSAERKVIS